MNIDTNKLKTTINPLLKKIADKGFEDMDIVLNIGGVTSHEKDIDFLYSSILKLITDCIDFEAYVLLYKYDINRSKSYTNYSVETNGYIVKPRLSKTKKNKILGLQILNY